MEENDREKLKVLLKYWSKHNKEHSQEFREWADKAKSSGESEICDDILDAAQGMDKTNEPLLRALKKLERER